MISWSSEARCHEPTDLIGPLTAQSPAHELPPLYYWRTHDGSEVDVFLETREGFLAIEIKSSTRWDASFNRSLKSLANFLSGKPLRCFGVYLGAHPARWDHVEVLPAREFLQRLWGDDLIQVPG